jgi:N utilization substance protein B
MVVSGTRSQLGGIDEMLSAHAKGWKLDRMAAVDRNLARLAVCEMCFAEEKLAPGIAINEAVELAKKFGTDDSSRYVNGILGAMMKAQ